LNLVSGQTNGLAQVINGTGSETDGGSGSLSVVGDPDPIGDACSAPTRNQVLMSGRNIGDLLNDAGVTWGSFMGGFDLTITNANGTTGCLRSSTGIAATLADYIPHHAFFQYHASTANPKHTRPASLSEIGHNGAANHNYDINDFYAAVKSGNFPAISFLKSPSFRMAMRAIPIRSTNKCSSLMYSTSCRKHPTGKAPPSSSCMTTPTAGTTIRWAPS